MSRLQCLATMTIPAVEVVVDRISSQEKLISFICKVATKSEYLKHWTQDVAPQLKSR